MRIAYDAAKSRRNVKERGIGFESAMELLSGTYVMRRDTRRDYGEPRVIGYGLIGGRMHVCVYTLRADVYRIISLRKANRREVDAYGPYVLG
jgi:uncharacterized DUF497 family protein